jgi:hypothetical protein
VQRSRVELSAGFHADLSLDSAASRSPAATAGTAAGIFYFSGTDYSAAKNRSAHSSGYHADVSVDAAGDPDCFPFGRRSSAAARGGGAELARTNDRGVSE